MSQAFPRATYRLQFRKEFGFADAASIVPYLSALGISHVYASPLLMARPGSNHGYDIVDHNRLNPEFGDEAAFEYFVNTLRRHDMGLILDIVPNHMWVGHDNPWWTDILKWGRASPFASFFDIDWEPPGRTRSGKLVLPVLGDQYGAVLEDGQLQLRFDERSGAFSIHYFDKMFPLSVRSELGILERVAACADHGPLDAPIAEFRAALGGRKARAGQAKRRDALGELGFRLAQLVAGDAETQRTMADVLAGLNGRPGDAASFDSLHRLLEQQAYRLAFWRVAAHEINYRRFFDINELAGLRMEQPELFEISHRLVGRLIGERKVQGLRIDHIDGLRAPKQYLQRLQWLANVKWRPDAATLPLFVAVEKILAPHERLRPDWPVSGATGYAFMAAVNGIFVDPASENRLTRFYRQFTGDPFDFGEAVVAAKRFIMNEVLSSELAVLANMFYRIAKQSRRTRDYTLAGFRDALEDAVAWFPVYRTYVTSRETAAQDRRDIEWALGRARKTTRMPDTSIYDFIGEILTLDILKTSPRTYRAPAVIDAALRFQQYTGPVMAKAAEDTAFYRYARLLSLNEVGSDPAHFGTSPVVLHEANRVRQKDHPFSMLATATHDHKRGEDVRARLNVLSEIPHEWPQQVRRWSKLNARKKIALDGRPAPDAHAEYIFYQTVVGAWPPGMAPPDYAGLETFRSRICAYMLKAAREAKLRTSWTAPDEDYEAALSQFVERTLAPDYSGPFLDSVSAFVERIAPAGALNGLAQTFLKLTAPGMPDIYQGTEVWDFSLVDPDNRRAVDYRSLGASLTGGDADNVETLLRNWRDGRIKQYVIRRILNFRRWQAELFAHGTYRDLQASGPRAENIFAFARTGGETVAIAAAPRLVSHDTIGTNGLVSANWNGTGLPLDGDIASIAVFEDALTGRTIRRTGGHLPAGEIFGTLPVALLLGRKPARESRTP